MKQVRFLLMATLAASILWMACDDDDDGGVGPPGDVTAPAQVADLAVEDVAATSVTLGWTAPGDDGNSGTAASYQMRVSDSPINAGNFAAATTVTGLPAPGAAGTAESFAVTGLDTTLTYYFAMRTRDEKGNTSAVSNNALWAPRGGPVQLQADIVAVKDNSVYHDPDNNSNGAGEFLFAGMTQLGNERRALMHFDIASVIPAGATIDSVVLTLHVSRSAPNSNTRTSTLHVITADWGEGTSDAGNPGGAGAPATTNDTTWLYRLWQTTQWTTPGGDFVATSSASASVPDDDEQFVVFTSEGMVTDVQAWLDTPATDFGWMLRGDETNDGTARQYDSRENSEPTFRPTLRVYYTVIL